ncbi:MAG TPA: DUF1428 domain-containing protein [Steroidobacteraceae bacterium]|nr:DUF1428 domain-containing protein [Steroidobacteraceae bacterium]
MNYIDCFLVPVPRASKADYEKMAKISAEVVKECGALRVVECWLDESGPDASTYHGEGARRDADQYSSFFMAAGAKQNETVVMSWIEWQDKAARDAGMEKFTSDPRMQFEGQPPAFEGSRLIAAGFVPMLDESRGK